MRLAAICLISSLALVGACSKPKPAESAAAGGTAGPAPAAGVALAPQPKVGLWSIAMSMDAGPGMNMTAQMCLDEKTRQSAYTASPERSQNCTPVRMTTRPGGVAFETACTKDGRTTTIRGVATGDFNSAYTMDTTITSDPPAPGGPAEMHMKTQAKWLGQCQPGQTPGQVTGMRFGGLGQG